MADENLMSMGDTGKADFKEEVVITEETAEKTVEEVIEDKSKDEEALKEEEIAKARELENQRKAEEFFWHKEDDLKKEVIEPTEEKPLEKSVSDLELVEKAKQAIEAAKRVTKFYEEKNASILEESKTLKTDIMEADIEIKALKAKIEELSNDKASRSNNYIETDDMRLRYRSNIEKNRKKNPDDPVLKAKAMEFLVDELSMYTPHKTPEEIRKFIAKQEEESIDVTLPSHSDYIKQSAKEIANKVTAEEKQKQVLNSIWRKPLNYSKY